MTYIEELYQTPEVLSRVRFKAEPMLTAAPSLVFCGCGTSYYLAGQMAKLCGLASRPAAAAEAVEILEYGPPETAEGTVFVFISRSGESMETVLAMRRVRGAGFPTFYLGCAPGSALDLGCAHACVLPFAAESMPLESFSFPAQLLALAQCCGLEEDDPQALAAGYRAMLSASEAVFKERLSEARIRRMICLSTPFYMPLMREAMLKNGELTQISSELWGILEFRHGPRSWADEGCLIEVLPGELLLDYERSAVQELVSYGARVLWLGEAPPAGTIGAAGLPARAGVKKTILLSAFLTGLAAEIGRASGVDASALKNLVYRVGEL